MTKKFDRTARSATKCLAWTFAVAFTCCWCASPARASILTFDIFDDAYSGTENVPEGYNVNQEYGDRIVDGSTQLATNGTTTFGYGDDGDNYTPNVTVSFGPFSIFTGGPAVWRYDYGNLTNVLYQGSTFTGIGNDYNVLDIVLVADPGYDVELLDFDLGGWFETDYTINAVTVYDGVPFPFITPTNQIFEEFNVAVAGSGPASTHFVPDTTPLDLDVDSPRAKVIWLRIDANNLVGTDSELIGIDNIRFRQVENGNPDEPPVDLSAIADGLQPAEVPEVASLIVWLGGLSCVGLAGKRRTRQSA